jgi:hypothetical protein
VAIVGLGIAAVLYNARYRKQMRRCGGSVKRSKRAGGGRYFPAFEVSLILRFGKTRMLFGFALDFAILRLHSRYSCSAKQARLLLRSTFRIFDFALNTPSRQNPNAVRFCARLFVFLTLS